MMPNFRYGKRNVCGAQESEMVVAKLALSTYFSYGVARCGHWWEDFGDDSNPS